MGKPEKKPRWFFTRNHYAHAHVNAYSTLLGWLTSLYYWTETYDGSRKFIWIPARREANQQRNISLEYMHDGKSRGASEEDDDQPFFHPFLFFLMRANLYKSFSRLLQRWNHPGESPVTPAPRRFESELKKCYAMSGISRGGRSGCLDR